MASNAGLHPRFGARIIREGWLYKRGEHIKNWRPRYFVLLDDGSLLGFKAKPDPGIYTDPLNDFTIRDCQLMAVDQPKPNTFLVRGLQWTMVIQRTFYTQTSEERELWMESIKEVSRRLKEEDERSGREEEAMDAISGRSDLDVIHNIGVGIAANKSKIGLEDFQFLKVLGKGTFGKVILAVENRTHKLYAIKLIKKKFIIDKGEVTHTLAENQVLQKTKHPFLTCLEYSFQTEDRLCFVMEFANGGELFFHLQRERIFPESRARFYGAEIVLALGYLHSKHIVYRDMKPENLLLDKDGHIKIADFGLCKEDIAFGDKTKTLCGTTEYMAPEVLEGSDYGRQVDWWGTGVVMYEMMCGRQPFNSKDHDELVELIRTVSFCIPKKLSSEAKSLFTGLLTKEPTKRLGGGPSDAIEIKEHPFFTSMDWGALYRKEIHPPFKPDVSSDTDTSYFDQEFTRQPLELTPLGRLGTQPHFMQFSFHASSQSSLNCKWDH